MRSFPENFGYELKDPFDDICEMLADRQPFSFARFGDGEFFAILGAEGENCDGHRYYPRLGQRLRAILAAKPSYLVGLQPLAVMRHGIQPVLAHSQGIRWVFSDSLHMAMHGGRLDRFFDALGDRDAMLVGPPHLRPLSRAKGWSHLTIPAINCWDRYEQTGQSLRESLPTSDVVVLFCASMMSNVLIDDLHAWCAENTYVDVGSVFDPCVGIASRPFYEELTPPFVLTGDASSPVTPT